MSARAAATHATHERIVDAACEAFMGDWYDDVTLRRIAADAGVALQTVVNHFGTKEALFGVASERIGDRIASTRWSVEPGDVKAATTVLVDDYERTGEMTLRMLSLEERVPVVRPMMDRGRAGHEEWVEFAFPQTLRGLRGATRRRRHAQLVVATDVYTWKLLRRDKGLDRDQTITAMRELILALHHNAGGGAT